MGELTGTAPPPAVRGLTRQGSEGSLTSKGRLSFARAMSGASVLRRGSGTRGGAAPAEAEDVGDHLETMSIGSCASKASRLSKVSQVSRSLLASLSIHRSSSSRASATPAMASLVEPVVVGDYCVTVAEVTVRQGEELDSESVCMLASGAALRVVQVSGRRLKITSGDIQGWISSKTKLDEVLVVKQVEYVCCSMEDPVVGKRYEVRSLTNLYTDAGIKSEVKAKLKPGTVVTVAELSPIDRYRVRISAPMVTGWINLVTPQGSPVVSEPSERNLGSEGVVFMPKYVKIKSLLEAAVSGNVEALRKAIEGRDSWFSAASARANLNCADVRGKTALMYAAALGHKTAVEYLLSKDNVDVNIADETKKTALHHASKRGRSRPAGEHAMTQSEIVYMLLAKRADIEARDHNGCTAIMFAVANGDEAVARRLMLSNADINVRDGEGHAPLDYAVNFGQTSIAEMLRTAGATGEVPAPSDDEQTSELAAGEAAPTEFAGGAAEDEEEEEEAAGAVGLAEAKAKKKKKKASPKEGADGPEAGEADDGKVAKEKKKKQTDKASKSTKAAKKGTRRASAAMTAMMEAITLGEMDDIVVNGEEEDAHQAPVQVPARVQKPAVRTSPKDQE